MCNRHWSDLDTFLILSSCSVYRPVLVVLQVLVLLYATFVFTFGLRQLMIQKRKDIPLSAAVMAFLFMLNYLILLCTGLDYVSGNYGLNFVHGSALSVLYLNGNLHNFRNLEVIRAVDSYTASKSVHWATHSKKINLILFIVTCILQYLKMLLPINHPEVDFLYIVASTSVISGTINTLPRVLYAYELKKILEDVQKENPASRENEYIKPIISELNTLFYGGIVGTFLIWNAILLAWMFIPILRENSYIIYNLQMFMAQSMGTTSLRYTRGSPINSPGEGLENNQNKKLVGIGAQPEKKTTQTTSVSSHDRAISIGSQDRGNLNHPSPTATPIISSQGTGEETAPLVSVDSGHQVDILSSSVAQSLDQSQTVVER